jgi:hypothetical protein
MEPAPAVLLCVMTVDIGDGRSGIVNIYSDSDCSQLAAEFVSEYDLDPEVLGALTDHIIANKALAEDRLLQASASAKNDMALEGAQAAIQSGPAPPALPEHLIDLAPTATKEESHVSVTGELDVLPVDVSPNEDAIDSDLIDAIVAPASAAPTDGPHSLASSRRIADREEDAEAEYEALQRQFDARKGKGMRRPSNSGASAATLGRSGIKDASPDPTTVIPDTGHITRSKMSAATLARLAAAPRKEEMPPLHSKQGKANPLLFNRLHSEASIRDRKMQERMAKSTGRRNACFGAGKEATAVAGQSS